LATRSLAAFVHSRVEVEVVSIEPNLARLVVKLISDGKVEDSLELLAGHYGVSVPRIRVGLPKSRRSKVQGCYSASDQTIYVLDRDRLKNPFVILHEFYHHLRTGVDEKHRGTERLASAFARKFIEESHSLKAGHSFKVLYAWVNSADDSRTN
jgi:hypothetical protein